jgi:hypothetical protein
MSLKFIKSEDEEEIARKAVEHLVPTVTPEPEFCIKTKGHCVESLILEETRVVFINICTSKAIPAPPKVSDEVIRKVLEYRGDENDLDSSILSYKLPVSVSEEKMEAGTYIYDVCMNPDILPLCTKYPDYELFIIELALEWVEERYSLQLNRRKLFLK